MRLVQEVALYGDNTLAKKLTSLDTQLSVTKGEIDAIISSSELTELRNGSSTMYSLLNSVKSDVNGTKQQLSEVLTKYDATSKQYAEMSTKLNQLSTSVNGNTASVSELKTSLGQTDQRVSTVTQTASGLTSTVSAIRSSLANDYSTTTQVSSMISQSADAIRLKADKIAWTSKYSSMTEDGKLTCQDGTFRGEVYQPYEDSVVVLRQGRLAFNVVTGGSVQNYAELGGNYLNAAYMRPMLDWGAKGYIGFSTAIGDKCRSIAFSYTEHGSATPKPKFGYFNVAENGHVNPKISGSYDGEKFAVFTPLDLYGHSMYGIGDINFLRVANTTNDIAIKRLTYHDGAAIIGGLQIKARVLIFDSDQVIIKDANGNRRNL